MKNYDHKKIEKKWQKENNYAFIDAQNIFLETKKVGLDIDWRAFRKFLYDIFSIKKAFIFIGYLPKNQKIYENYKKSDFKIIFKEVVADSNGKLKGNVDAELVLESMKRLDEYDKAVIVSSDGDFACLVKYLKENKKFRAVISPTRKSCSYLLRKAVGGRIVYLENSKNKFEKQTKSRA